MSRYAQSLLWTSEHELFSVVFGLFSPRIICLGPYGAETTWQDAPTCSPVQFPWQTAHSDRQQGVVVGEPTETGKTVAGLLAEPLAQCDIWLVLVCGCWLPLKGARTCKTNRLW